MTTGRVGSLGHGDCGTAIRVETGLAMPTIAVSRMAYEAGLGGTIGSRYDSAVTKGEMARKLT